MLEMIDASGNKSSDKWKIIKKKSAYWTVTQLCLEIFIIHPVYLRQS